MRDLIDREALVEQIKEDSYGCEGSYGDMWRFMDTINKMPSIRPTRPTPSNTLGTLDCVDRNEAIKNLEQYKDLFSRDDGDRERYVLTRVIKELKAMPSAQPKTQKLLDDGTLIVHTDIDITKITRVNITQNNTHYGDLFYRDEE